MTSPSEQEAVLARLIKDWEARFGELHQKIERFETEKSGPVRFFPAKIISLYFRDAHAEVRIDIDGELTVLRNPDTPRPAFQHPHSDVLEHIPEATKPHMGMTPRDAA
jgi:hypothetical protein